MTNLKDLCGDRYKVTDDGTDDTDRAERVWCLQINGRHGAIYPYGHNGDLAVMVKSAQVATRVKDMGLRIVQRGDWETVFVFNPGMVDEIANIIKARRRRRLSPEERARCTERLLKLRRPAQNPKPLNPT